MRLRLEHFDHNERFAKLLPSDGIVVWAVKSSNDTNWFVFEFDSGIEYEGGRYSDLLIRSRWRHGEVGDGEPNSVFIHLLEDAGALQDGFSADTLPHVAWGMVATD